MCLLFEILFSPRPEKVPMLGLFRYNEKGINTKRGEYCGRRAWKFVRFMRKDKNNPAVHGSFDALKQFNPAEGWFSFFVKKASAPRIVNGLKGVPVCFKY